MTEASCSEQIRKDAHSIFDPVWAGSAYMPTSGAYLIKELIGAEQMGVLYGPPGVGKSFYALDLAMRIATGRQFGDRKIAQHWVLYVAAEGQSGFLKRIKACMQETFRGFDNPPLLLVPNAVNLREEQDVEMLTALAREDHFGLQCGMVVIDTMARCFGGGNENDGADMAEYIAGAERLKQHTGATVMNVHHSGKDTSRGPRGHNSLVGASDFLIAMRRPDDAGALSAYVEKQKDGEAHYSLGFTLRKVCVGTDEDGDVITSCVVDHMGQLPAGKSSGGRKGKTKTVLEALRALLSEQGADASDATGFPIRAVPTDLLRRELWDRDLLGGGNEDSKKRAYMRILKDLQSKNAIVVKAGYVWLATDAESGRTTDTPLKGECPSVRASEPTMGRA